MARKYTLNEKKKEWKNSYISLKNLEERDHVEELRVDGG